MSKRVYGKDKVTSALGATLLLFSLLLFLAPGTSFCYLVFPLFYLFGLAGIWFVLPFFMVTGVILVIYHSLPKKRFCGNAFLAFFFLLLGFSLLFTTSLSDFSSYSESLVQFLKEEEAIKMYFSLDAGGGILGYGLMSLFSLGGLPLSYFIGSLLLLLGIVSFLFPYFFLWMDLYKSRLRFQEEKKSYLPHEEMTNSPQEVPTLKVEEEKSSTSRSELYMDLPKVDVAEEFIAPPKRYSEAAHDDGLKPVYFDENKESVSQKIVHAQDVTPSSKEEPSSIKTGESTLRKEEKAPSFDDSFERSRKEEIKESVLSSIEKKDESPLLKETPYDSSKEEKKEENVSLSSSLEEAPLKKEAESVTLPNLPNEQEETRPVTLEEKKEETLPLPEVDLGPALSEEEITLMKLGQGKRKERASYEFPSLDLLKAYGSLENEEEIHKECEVRKDAINQAFMDLGVGASIAGYTIGPSVTRYDIQTEKNVSVSTVTRFVKDLSVRLGGVQTRYEEVVMGSPYSGLEIANTETTTVGLREMMEHMKPREKLPLAVPFGKTISGECVSGDLGDFPHMLVAGTSGSGKSVFMHGLIMSLIMRNRPEDLRLLMIDPKKAELNKYRELPHLLCPIITDAQQAKVALDRLCDEMERRFDIISAADVSSINEFNRDYAPDYDLEPLPVIVCFIDEYADLVDSCKMIGEPVVKLAQKARAAGIHLVVATQRPSVNVINGTIKANLLVRVALAVSSYVDSNTILDQGGAENLVGHGDMLISCAQLSRTGLVRAQGCYVSGREIREVCDFIRQERSANYDPKFLNLEEKEESIITVATAPKVDHASLKQATDNEFYEEVRAYVMTLDYCSVSALRRVYGIGFPKAGSIFDRLKKEGIVASGPTSTSAKGSKVLIHTEEELEASLRLLEEKSDEGGN